jgi:predicted phage-related endonuclease
MVGFHDFLSVLISGNCYVGKLSSKDDVLMTRIIHLLKNIEPKFEEYIQIKKDKLSGFDAVIATGSNNTARYFEYYFGKYPHIIRKNRNSAAVLSGSESDDELIALADDIFMYFGLGCRSISKLFLPL